MKLKHIWPSPRSFADNFLRSFSFHIITRKYSNLRYVLIFSCDLRGSDFIFQLLYDGLSIIGYLPLGYLPNYFQGVVRDISRYYPRYIKVLSIMDILIHLPNYCFLRFAQLYQSFAQLFQGFA